MRRTQKQIRLNAPLKGYCNNPIRIAYSVAQGGVSYNLFFPIADYIEQKQSKVQFVVLNEISKSVQRPCDLTT
jgi:hypothetical protein